MQKWLKSEGNNIIIIIVYLEHEVLPMPLVPVTSTHRVIYMHTYIDILNVIVTRP